MLSGILFSKNQNWYAERRPSQRDARIYFAEKPYYSRNSRRADRERIFHDELRQIGNDYGIEVYFEENSFIFDDKRFPNLNQCLFGHDWGQIAECVCHGDLNGNNIMYTGEGAEVAFIDFQNTGFHHLFRDFVSFESAVRLEIPESNISKEDEFRSLLELERELVNVEWQEMQDTANYVGEISKIRYAANRNFEDAAFSHYLLANTVHSLWLLERGDRWPKFQKHRLVATILASLEGLEKSKQQKKSKQQNRINSGR